MFQVQNPQKLWLVSGILIICSIILGACEDKSSFDPKSAKSFKLEDNEGFYTLNQLPPKWLRKFNIKRRDLNAPWKTVGAFQYNTKKKYTKKEALNEKLRACSLKNQRLWNKEFCEEIEDCLNRQSCEINQTSHCGGVAVRGNFFLTAQHCTGGKSDVPFKAKFITNGKVKTYDLEPTKYSVHKLPHDVSVFKIEGYKGATAKIAMYRSTDGETVSAIGFPYVLFRTPNFTDYPLPWGSKRINLGRIVDSNRTRKSFCNFSNNVSEALPETWELESFCPETKPRKVSETLTLREERDPLLTNTDMIFGMSGSGLFNPKGELVGIGTTVLSSEPGDYSSSTPGVYVKALYAQMMIDQLDCEDCTHLPPPYLDKDAYDELTERRLWYAKNRTSYFYNTFQSTRFKDGEELSLSEFSTLDDIKFEKGENKKWIVKIQARKESLIIQCKVCGDFFKPFNLLEKNNWVSPMGIQLTGYFSNGEFVVYFKNPERDHSAIKKKLGFFPFNKNAIVEATLTKNDKKERKTFDTSAEREKVLYSFGTVKFNWKGKEVETPVYTWDPPEKPTKGLMLAFRDKTNGKGTYKGGRYLNFSHPDFDRIKKFKIDFNQTYHPNCAFTPYYNCIIPNDPKLQVAIKAGEKYSK